MKLETTAILGVHVAHLTLETTQEWLAEAVQARVPRQLVTANAEIIYRAHREADFKALLQQADLITADGVGVVWAAKILGNPLPAKVPGSDLIEPLFKLAEEQGWSLYFLGAQNQVVEKAVLNALATHPRLKLAGYHHGYYSQEEVAGVVKNIREAQPDILLVGMGAPRQECFIHEQLNEMRVPVSLGVGGVFDLLAGTAKRAPLWMQRSGLEWLYRLLKEPRRLARMLALPCFVWAVWLEKSRIRHVGK